MIKKQESLRENKKSI